MPKELSGALREYFYAAASDGCDYAHGSDLSGQPWAGVLEGPFHPSDLFAEEVLGRPLADDERAEIGRTGAVLIKEIGGETEAVLAYSWEEADAVRVDWANYLGLDPEDPYDAKEE